jgi:citrate/tricarballylate utilization protein
VLAVYGIPSLPKLFGLPGGVLLTIGTAALLWLKTKADPALCAPTMWDATMVFTLPHGRIASGMRSSRANKIVAIQ